MAGAESEPLRARLCAPLEAHHLATLEAAIDTDLALGRHARAVEALTPLVAEHPFSENLRRWLMTALPACGRRTEALRVFQDARPTPADELGVPPGPRLRELYREALGTGSRASAGRAPRLAARYSPGRGRQLAATVSPAAASFAVRGP